jgi:hypothetical protein
MLDFESFQLGVGHPAAKGWLTVFSCQFSVREEEAFRPLDEAVGAGAEEGEEAKVAEDLELLADFVADVGVVGVEFG